MKKTVWWVVVSLAMAGASLVMGRGTAWAQETQEPRAVVLCNGDLTKVSVTEAEWARMDFLEQHTECFNTWIRKNVAQAQPTPVAQEHGRKLAIAGLVVTLAGVALVLPQGHNDYILGDTYCVQDTTSSVSVDYGSCTSVAPKYGAIALAAGVTMMAIGFHQMSVSPEITPTSKAIKATIKWGGSHAKR